MQKNQPKNTEEILILQKNVLTLLSPLGTDGLGLPSARLASKQTVKLPF